MDAALMFSSHSLTYINHLGLAATGCARQLTRFSWPLFELIATPSDPSQAHCETVCPCSIAADVPAPTQLRCAHRATCSATLASLLPSSKTAAVQSLSCQQHWTTSASCMRLHDIDSTPQASWHTIVHCAQIPSWYACQPALNVV